ncbi:hypothetical protein CRUP_006389 [Coryphaenoides rupestris]|nr:hypothetical protein CRUP_006389 [Coryphaenoides rupestris]
MDCVEASPPKEESNEEPTEEAQNSKKPTEEEQNSKKPTDEAQKSKEEQNTNELTEEEEVAPEMEPRRSKRGHPSPAAKSPSIRHSTRSSTPAKKKESPAGNPVKVEVDEQIVDSVEEGSSSTRGGGSPPSGLLMPQGQPKPDEDKGDDQVVDSVEGDVAEDEGIQISTRRPTTRGKRGRPPQQTAKNAREASSVSEEAKKEPHDPVENQDSPTMTETQDQEATEPNYHIIDSVGGEPNMEEPANQGEESRGKEGAAEGTKVAGISLEKVATYQVLDCVEEEMVPPVTKATKGRGRKTGERRGGKAANPPMMKDNQLSLEETMFELLDVAEEAAEQPGRPRRGLAKKDPPPAREGKTSRHTTPEGAKQDQEEKEEEEAHPGGEFSDDQKTAAGKRRRRRRRRRNEEVVVVSGTSKMATKEGKQMQDSQEEVYQVVDSVGWEEEQVPKEPVRGKRGRKVTRNDANTEASKKKTKEQSTAPKGDNGGGVKENVLVSLDEVGNDSVEEEELRRQAFTKEMRREEEEEEERNVGSEMEGLVTLDEVGEEEEEEEEESGISEAELQALVTVDEIVEDEQEGEGQAPAEPLPHEQSEATWGTEVREY